MSDYKISNKAKKKQVLDPSKKNILIIGSSNNNNQSKVILNPANIETARQLYGEDNDLFRAYKLAYEITNDSNVYTVNCPMSTDFIEIIDTIVNYNFSYIVPIDIFLQDTFINPINEKKTYFCNYYIERLGVVDNLATLIMTDRPSYLYESIDDFLLEIESIFEEYQSASSHLLDQYGANMVFVLNNLNESYYSNVLLAATLSINTFNKYPDSVSFKTHFDIDELDINNTNFSYFKYCENTDSCTIENLKNLRPEEDIYKWVLIDEAIKHVIRNLDLDDFKGKYYTPYVKTQMNIRIKQILESMRNVVFRQYTIESIQFVKTAPAVGYMSIKISFVPYGTLERINIVMGV